MKIKTAVGESGTKNSQRSSGQVALESRASAKGGCTCTNCWEVEPLAELREKMLTGMSAAKKVVAVDTAKESNVAVD